MHFKIFKISSCSMVSVRTTHGISVIFITESRSRRCMKIISELNLSIRCCCLNKASKSFKDTAIRSFPNRLDTSSISSNDSGLEKFRIARFAPVYRIFFTSSCLRTFPPATIGILMARFTFFIRSIASSCSSSVLDRSNTISSSAPLSQYCFASPITSSETTSLSSNHFIAFPL